MTSMFNFFVRMPFLLHVWFPFFDRFCESIPFAEDAFSLVSPMLMHCNKNSSNDIKRISTKEKVLEQLLAQTEG